MSWNAKPVPAMKLGEIGFEVKNSFTYGQSTSTSTSQTYSSGCTCDSDHCKGPFTHLNYRLKVVSSSLKVKLTVSKCGTTKVIDGEVKTHQFQGKYECGIKDGLTSRPKFSRLFEGTHMVFNNGLNSPAKQDKSEATPPVVWGMSSKLRGLGVVAGLASLTGGAAFLKLRRAKVYFPVTRFDPNQA